MDKRSPKTNGYSQEKSPSSTPEERLHPRPRARRIVQRKERGFALSHESHSPAEASRRERPHTTTNESWGSTRNTIEEIGPPSADPTTSTMNNIQGRARRRIQLASSETRQDVPPPDTSHRRGFGGAVKKGIFCYLKKEHTCNRMLHSLPKQNPGTPQQA